MASAPRHPGGPAERLAQLRRRIHKLKKDQTRLASMLSAADELASRIECDIVLLLEEMATWPDMPVRRRQRRSPRRPRHFQERRLTPEPRAAEVKRVPMSDGGSLVTIDGGKPLRLQPRLSQLLDVLCVDNGRSDDDLLGWRSLDHVARLLTMQTGTRISKQNVRQLIYRLRNKLADAGYDWRLVQTNRRLGVRLALRRDAPAAVGDDRE